MESSSLQNERDGRERDTKRKMELFPQALALLQALQMCSSCLQNAKDLFPLAKTEEKGQTWHISENCRLAEASHHQAQATKQFWNFACTARQSPDAARRWAAGRVIFAWLAPGAWHWKKVSPGGVFVAPCNYCFFHISCLFAFFLLLMITHLFGILEQSFPSTKRTQKWGLVVYLDQCNPKCIYLQK